MTYFIPGLLIAKLKSDCDSWVDVDDSTAQIYDSNSFTYTTLTNMSAAHDPDGRPLYAVLAEIENLPDHWARVITPVQ